MQFTKPADHIYTGRDIGADTGDSDADTATGRSQVLTLVSGENNTTLDAGIYAQASLGDRVWLDANGNGLQDAGEAGIAGVKVKLHRRRRRRRHQRQRRHQGRRVTDANGNYLFTGLNPGGEYQVEFERPSDAIFTGRDRGDDAADSDADATTSRSQVVRLASGEHNRCGRRGRLLQRQPGRQGLARRQRQRPPGRGRGGHQGREPSRWSAAAPTGSSRRRPTTPPSPRSPTATAPTASPA